MLKKTLWIVQGWVKNRVFLQEYMQWIWPMMLNIFLFYIFFFHLFNLLGCKTINILSGIILVVETMIAKFYIFFSWRRAGWSRGSGFMTHCPNPWKNQKGEKEMTVNYNGSINCKKKFYIILHSVGVNFVAILFVFFLNYIYR